VRVEKRSSRKTETARMTDPIGPAAPYNDVLDRVMLRIASSLDLDATFRAVVEAAAELTGAASAVLYVRESPTAYRAVASYGVALDRLQRDVVLTPSSGLLSRMVRTGEPVQVRNFASEVDNASGHAREVVEEVGALSTLGVPLMSDGECLGALYVARASTEAYLNDEVRAMERLAAHAQVALRNAQRFATTEGARARLQSYVDAIPEGVLVLDLEGTVVLSNFRVERSLGVSHSIVGVNAGSMFEPGEIFAGMPIRYLHDQLAAFRDVLATGEPAQGLLEVGDPSRLCEVNYSALRAGEGSIEGVVVTVRDITAPLELERERARSGVLSHLLELSADLNSELSISVLIERVVEAAMALIGTATGALGLVEGEHMVFTRFHAPTGWHDFDVRLSIGDGAPGHVWKTAQPFVSNDAKHAQFVLQNYRDQLQFDRLAYVPVFDRGGRVIGALGVYDPIVGRDLTGADVEVLQLFAHQAAIAIENARLNELKDEFLSIVSHELKTPVTSIKGFAQILQRRLADDAPSGTRRYLEVINHQADRLTALINDLLDLSRIQTGRFVFNLEPSDYGALVHDVLTETALVSTGNSITYNGPEHVWVHGNPNRLRQVLVNLIDNGIKHGPQGGAIHVTVEIDGDQVVTYVCDEGPSLPPEEAERIFAQYYQVRHGAESHARGLGLGLFISRQIVNEHGGRIWLDDVDHTSFCYTLVMVDPETARPHDEDVHAHAMAVDLRTAFREA
jgi:signal transduction histidine kinase